ncbi:concanavalin A-like lectin/glucanase domain-containing protein [Amylocystis lapponica]|nr:concanavalin A-like lectin/glucanase domain-containing protein [Amylocystis lapponica]
MHSTLVIFAVLASAFGKTPLGLAQTLRPDWLTPRTTYGSQCQPFQSTFSQADFSSHFLLAGDPSFVAISPASSYRIGPGGLQLFLEKPHGSVTTKDGVNDKIADGATINSTFTLLYGRVTLNLSAPAVPGIVTAAILIADETDEIDVELVGGDPKHWQTNVFASSPKDKQPLWGVFGEIEDYANKGTVEEEHAYAVDWNDERIIWSVDGEEVRTLHKGTHPHLKQNGCRLILFYRSNKKNGALHFPSHPTRIQLGIWDASAPAGTAQWAKGPVDWSSAPEKMAATFKSVTVECPYN